ncbi:MAG: TSUP family transporter [Actinobacteria bacterium]|nr:TSUP family transporter [Actinomycetota bacterium]
MEGEPPRHAGVGFAAGLLAGLFGIGEGIVMVPLLVSACGLSQHHAHACRCRKPESRSCRTLILVDQATENISADHRSQRSTEFRRRGCRSRRIHVERAMGPVPVVGGM